jgi:NAD+ synthase (glutamine-hydrolysing)
MANRFNYLLLSTSNKSEAAVGYTTVYGDMTGGIGVVSDVFKTQVYELARYMNSRGGNQVIPQRMLEKPPSAELRPGQVDQDSLPPYEKLDAMLKLYVEEKLDVSAIVERTGFERGLVSDILRRVDAAEFKRRQAPPGLRVSDKSFGLGRRMPLAMNWDRTFNT